jgi:hypothetical protein
MADNAFDRAVEHRGPPLYSVYEERMHSWVHMPSNIEHMA